MTIMITDPTVLVPLGMICALAGFTWMMFKLINDKGVEQREETIRSLKVENVKLTEKNEKLVKWYGDATRDRMADRRELSELQRKVARAAKILGFAESGDDEEEEGEEEEKDDDPSPAPESGLYACALDGKDEFMAVLVRARSEAEAIGKAHKIADEEFPDERVDIHVSGTVREPEATS